MVYGDYNRHEVKFNHYFRVLITGRLPSRASVQTPLHPSPKIIHYDEVAIYMEAMSKVEFMVLPQ